MDGVTRSDLGHVENLDPSRCRETFRSIRVTVPSHRVRDEHLGNRAQVIDRQIPGTIEQLGPPRVPTSSPTRSITWSDRRLLRITVDVGQLPTMTNPPLRTPSAVKGQAQLA